MPFAGEGLVEGEGLVAIEPQKTKPALDVQSSTWWNPQSSHFRQLTEQKKNKNDGIPFGRWLKEAMMSSARRPQMKLWNVSLMDGFIIELPVQTFISCEEKKHCERWI